MEASSLAKFNELTYYTLGHPDKIYFIHQHIVDAYQVQTADESTKSIAIPFSLVRLNLYIEKNYTGREVQLVHMKLAKHKKVWPTFELPNQMGAITISDVLKAAPGQMRDARIKEWCTSVWRACENCHERVASPVRSELGV
jgi:hypothetical protein